MTTTERLALRVVQLGAIAVILAASTLTAFDLDRFFVPKELVLHLTALVAGLMLFRRVPGARVDLLLAAYLGLGVLSAVMATNPWLAIRAMAISASGILLFWIARALRAAGLARPLLGVLALAVVLAAVTSLLQTYGVDLALFADTRAPGGTLGNRNFVAHVAAFGLPLLLLVALRRKAGMLGVAIVTASLVLTRSRAAWLALGAVVVVFLLAILVSPLLRRDPRTWRRLVLAALCAGAGVAAALTIPNALHWRGKDPYLQTVKRVADYQGGSGRGRLVQFAQSLKMAARHPLFGVGPGNWPVVYPAHAARNDPSMSDSEAGMTSNPWPSSDWVAWVAERGVAAVVLLALAFAGIAAGGLRQLRAALDADEALLAASLLATLAGIAVTGLFDAVLLLAVPTFLAWTALGALWVPREERSANRLVLFGVIVICALGAVRSASELTAMRIYATRSDRASLTRAAQIDPGNYRIQMRLAHLGGRGRCEHARAARALFPNAKAAAEVARGCGK